MTRRVLVVCTANVCRSPVVSRLLQRRLDGEVDVDGFHWVVTSAGTADITPEVDPQTVAAAKQIGLQVGDHQRRTLTREILNTDGHEVVIAMTRENLRAVIAVDRSAWPRTFTLKELARRSVSLVGASPIEGFRDWLTCLAERRRASEMIHPDPADDIADPYGRPRRDHDAMVSDVADLVDTIVRTGPWLP